jgi:hypothetical protein
MMPVPGDLGYLEVNRYERITSCLPTIREFTFNSVNTCAFSGIRTTILGARNPPPIG